MRAMLFLAAATLLSTGCGTHYRDTTLYQLSGRQKPIVAVLPVINHTQETNLQWDLSRELTDEIRNRVYNSKRIYLLKDGGSPEIAEAFSVANPQAITRTAAGSLGAAEFAVVAEIIEQEEVPYGVNRKSVDEPMHSDLGAVLSLALRIRVVDIRHETPKVILQEVIDKDYVVARAYMNCNYEKMPWGTEAFNTTPMGIAHNRLVRELVSRIEAYIEAVR